MAFEPLLNNFRISLTKDIIRPTVLVHFRRSLSADVQKLMSLINFIATSFEPNTPDGFYRLNKKMILRYLNIPATRRGGCYGLFQEIYENSLRWNIFGGVINDTRVTREREYRLLTSLGQSVFDDAYHDKNCATIEFKINEDLLAVMLEPTIYGKVKLIMLAVLEENKYSFALYEFVCDLYYRSYMSAIKAGTISKGDHYEAVALIKIDDIFDYLDIEEASSYRRWQNLKTKILLPCLKEINDNSDMHVEVNLKKSEKDGKRVVKIHVEIRPQDWEAPLYVRKIEKLKADLYAEHLKPRCTRIQSITDQFKKTQEEAKRFVADVIEFADKENVSVNRLREQTVINAINEFGIQGVEEVIENFKTQYYSRKGSPDPIGRNKDVSGYLAKCLLSGIGIKTADEREQQLRRIEEQRKKERLKELWEMIKQVREKVREQNKIKFNSSSFSDDLIGPCRTKFESSIENDTSPENRELRRDFSLNGWMANGIEEKFRKFLEVELFPVTDADCVTEAGKSGWDYMSMKREYNELQLRLQNQSVGQ